MYFQYATNCALVLRVGSGLYPSEYGYQSPSISWLSRMKIGSLNCFTPAIQPSRYQSHFPEVTSPSLGELGMSCQSIQVQAISGTMPSLRLSSAYPFASFQHGLPSGAASCLTQVRQRPFSWQ